MIVADFVFYLHEIRHDHGRLAQAVIEAPRQAL